MGQLNVARLVRAFLSQEATPRLNVIDDDDAATNGTPLYLLHKRGETQEAVLASEMASGETIEIKDTREEVRLPVLERTTEDATVGVTDDDAADSNGTAVYLVPVGPVKNGVQLMKMVSVNAHNADAVFETTNPTDEFLVEDSNDAATVPGATLLYFDEDADAGQRFLAANGSGVNMYVKSIGGRYLFVSHDASPGGDGVQVYFHDDATAEAERLLFIGPSDADGSDTTSQVAGLFAVEDEYLEPVYVDEDVQPEYERFIIDLPVEARSHILGIAEGRVMVFAHNDAPGDAGTRVYIDDDADIEKRLLTVSAGDADFTVDFHPYLRLFGMTFDL